MHIYQNKGKKDVKIVSFSAANHISQPVQCMTMKSYTLSKIGFLSIGLISVSTSYAQQPFDLQTTASRANAVALEQDRAVLMQQTAQQHAQALG